MADWHKTKADPPAATGLYLTYTKGNTYPRLLPYSNQLRKIDPALAKGKSRGFYTIDMNGECKRIEPDWWMELPEKPKEDDE